MHPISLIQMPNGTGKTTTLTLLRAALSGVASDGGWPPPKVRSFRKDANTTDGIFQVSLMHNDRRMTITLRFDFEENSITYSTTLPAGMKRGFEPPRDLAKFFRPDFVPFFVFDGELAEHLLDREHTDAQTAIENLFQLGLFTSMAARVDDYWNNVVAGKSASEERGLSRRRNRVERLKLRLGELQAQQEKLVKARDSIKRRLLQKENQFKAAIEAREAHKERVQQAEQRLTQAEHRVELLTAQALAAFRDPHSLRASNALGMADLKANLDRVKLPERAAREFFEELATEEECVCGRPLDDETREAIRERAQRYLGSDDVALLNAMKSDIADRVGSEPASHESGLAERVRELVVAVDTADQRRTDRDAVREDAIAGDPGLEEANSEIQALHAELRDCEDRLSRFEDPTDTASDEDTLGIAVLERRLKDAERKLAEITHTLELKYRTEALSGILDVAHQAARARLSEQVCSEANARIRELMPHNDIWIDRVERCLALRGKEGGSVGETLSVAYAFLATLFNRTDHQLPFVVDSPANPIDLKVRGQVAQLIPRLAPQFIAFTISSERQGFFEHLEASSGQSIQCLTLFRKGAQELENAAMGVDGATSTTDGIVVENREFFTAFHLDAEG